LFFAIAQLSCSECVALRHKKTRVAGVLSQIAMEELMTLLSSPSQHPRPHLIGGLMITPLALKEDEPPQYFLQVGV